MNAVIPVYQGDEDNLANSHNGSARLPFSSMIVAFLVFLLTNAMVSSHSVVVGNSNYNTLSFSLFLDCQGYPVLSQLVKDLGGRV